ncbi:MAG: hypothetical protein DMD79_19790 [Candidatus Rokuibacteriota bacterium]|nr:MAG: hypothetical protein DMD79_19790 [Candidatus Rokubacteria bacterium]
MHRRLRARAGQMRDAALEGGEVFRLAARAFGKPDQDIAAVERIIAGLHGIFLFVAAANSWPPRTMGMMPMIFLADRASAIVHKVIQHPVLSQSSAGASCPMGIGEEAGCPWQPLDDTRGPGTLASRLHLVEASQP